jgi:hypothetical protein
MIVPPSTEPLEKELQALQIENGRLKTALEKSQADLRKLKNLVAHIHWAIKVGTPQEAK